MDQTTHEVRLEQWVSIISQCQNRPEGQTAKEWLRKNGKLLSGRGDVQECR